LVGTAYSRTIRRPYRPFACRRVPPFRPLAMSATSRIDCPIAMFVSLAALTGCTAEVHRYVRFPDFLHPGWAQHQRSEAIEHDPYVLNDVGPEVVGGRPREYLQPVNEVERARMNATPPVAFQPVPVPSLPSPPPATVAPPPVATTPPILTTPFPPTPVISPSGQVRARSPY
jgi:hypothetical protein